MGNSEFPQAVGRQSVIRMRRGDAIPVPVAGVLDGSGLRGVIDMDDSEPLIEAAHPLKVVEKTPNEVPANIDTFAANLGDLVDVAREVVGSSRIVHPAVR